MTYRVEGLNAAVFVLLGFLAAVAFVSNAVIILILVMWNNIRSSTNSVFVLVFNLALSDLIFSGLSLPLILASTTIKLDWSLGNIGCKLVMFLPNFCVAATIFTLCIIAHDRRVAIKSGSAGGRERIRVFAIGVTIFIWVSAFIVASPALYEYSVYTKTVVVGESPSSSSEEEDSHEDSGDIDNLATEVPVNVTTYRSCGSHGIPESFEQTYATLLTLTIYICPLIFISINYGLILAFIWKKEQELKQTMNQTTSKKTAVSGNTVRVLKMLISVLAVFTIGWAPYFYLFFREEVTGSDDTANFGDVLHIIKLFMAISSSVLNPILYGLFNKRIRGGLHSMFRWLPGFRSLSSVGPTESTVVAPKTVNANLQTQE